MPPKVKYTRDEIVNAALEITRKRGADAVTARNIAEALGSSVKPIFCYFRSMEELRLAVIAAANEIYNSYLAVDMSEQKYPPYKASGIAYIRFAREEKELFRLLYMRDRRGEQIGEDREAIRPLLELIMQNLGIDEDSAYLLHLELWIYVHGIATMAATSYLDWDMEFVSKTLTDVYFGLKHRYTEKEN